MLLNHLTKYSIYSRLYHFSAKQCFWKSQWRLHTEKDFITFCPFHSGRFDANLHVWCFLKGGFVFVSRKLRRNHLLTNPALPLAPNVFVREISAPGNTRDGFNRVWLIFHPRPLSLVLSVPNLHLHLQLSLYHWCISDLKNSTVVATPQIIIIWIMIIINDN